MTDLPTRYYQEIMERLRQRFPLKEINFDNKNYTFTQRAIFSLKKEIIPEQIVEEIYKEILDDEKNESNISYKTGWWITGTIIFIIVWIYSITEWGFLFGIMFGWIPAIIAALIGGLLWPLILIIVVILFLTSL